MDEQVQAFRERFGGVSLRRARRAHLTAHDVVTIASMVEREAQVARERPLIAAVIWNRLRGSIPLGIDATLRFALHNWTRPLRESELRNPRPSTRAGTAACRPRRSAAPGWRPLRAAANPAHVGYLYYVVRPGTCGRHAFSSTTAKFDRDVARYNAARSPQRRPLAHDLQGLVDDGRAWASSGGRWPTAARRLWAHAAAFAAVGPEDWRYQHLPVPPELFSETARALGGAGFAGANVTIPHKEAVLAVADAP